MFLVYDDHLKKWCAYAKESSWKSQVAALAADTVASMHFSEGRLISIDVTTQDETGDWMVFDHYTIETGGNLQQLRRRINILPGDRSVSEIYLIAIGKAKLQSRATTSLTTGKELTGSEDWLPEVPTFSRLGDFSFAAPGSCEVFRDRLQGKVLCP